MKVLFIFVILFPIQFFAKSFRFPDVAFSYAKIYYFNLGEITTRPDDYIYTDETGFAKSIQGEGKQVSNSLTANIEKLFLYNRDGLLNGLSGCYIPRHGIIYFDNNDQPVASLSICFECGAIRMWTQKSGKILSKNRKDVTGEGQIETLKNFIQKEDVIVSDKPKDYQQVIIPKTQESINMLAMDSSIFNATYSDVKLWFTTAPDSSASIKYSAGGDKYEFGKLSLGQTIQFLFMSNTPSSEIGEAIIASDEIVLPNGIKIGSSLDDVMNTMLVYDGPSNPSVITITDGNKKIVYTFEDQILVLITINK